MVCHTIVPHLTRLSAKEYARKGGNVEERIDNVAVICRDILNTHPSIRVRHRVLIREVETTFDWLYDACQPLVNRFLNKYMPNSRFDRHDMEQSIREEMLRSIIPRYNPDAANFLGYFSSVGWRRLRETVAANASPFSTPKRFVSEKDPIVFRARNTHLSLDQPIVRDGDEVPLHQLVADNRTSNIAVITESRASLRLLLGFLKSNLLTDLEKTAFIAVALNHQPYADVFQNTKQDKKAVDNAMQRAKNKLSKAFLEHGLTIEEVLSL